MKVALVAESFLPQSNGVTNSLLRVIDHLTARGDEAMVIAPESRGSQGPVRYGIASITRLPAMGWPGYRDVRVALSGVGKISRVLEEYDPDIVHLASPFTLGWTAVRAANELNLPCVAIYQTEIPSYAPRYGLAWGEGILWNRLLNIHERADLTLAPSTYAMSQLEQLGVPRLRLWPRGVDADRFHPSKRSEALRSRWAPNGEIVVGYVGRLAAEKRIEDLARLAEIDGIRVVIVGEGPSHEKLKALLPDAQFLGFLTGDDLAETVASFDLFVHCGEVETFCQTIQEALASGVPIVAPRRGGPIDLVDHGETGFLYTPGDLDAMVAYVTMLAEDAELRERFAAHTRMSVEGRTWEKVCDRLMDYYAEATRIHEHRPVLLPETDKILKGLMWRPGEVAAAKARHREAAGRGANHRDIAGWDIAGRDNAEEDAAEEDAAAGAEP
ncbi:glycosyltransferase family 4 protein [Demequina lutea]|uniref:D-inositol 3-phosphate glycosyltransferase n=1 Tax=Demequina lutea TaxID=431489 RepID=A0A7Y9ZCW7_9MICO|nr:glycosyltransferase family 1 protein [Demequina lutea]NYI41021.1 phosphatidylinositol alpha 1,6-mannosyltransferase [Demequina lutea]